MTGGPCALRSRIDQQLGRRWFRTGHNTDAARLKPVGAKRDRRGIQQIELLQTVRPQQPDRLLGRTGRGILEVAAAKYYGPDGQRVEQMPGTVAAGREHTAPVITPKARHRPRLPQPSDETKHLVEGLVKRRRYLRPVRGREDPCAEEYVQ